MHSKPETENLPLKKIEIVEATISELLEALANGAITSVELVARYLDRIGYYDRHGLHLNAVPIINPNVFSDAADSDRRRSQGQPARPLEGIPFTVKDSYKVAGLTVASGSPAFKDLIANDDAHTISCLREAGGILIGKTTMPPMADGGMERGVYGRAESPYNTDYLTAAYASGSSNGSGTATAASFSAFGMGEETLSSGRSPASNNALVAYTPSRGLISIRGNWPLFPTCDVVVPHTRTVKDLLALLDVLVAEDSVSRGDFWREQHFIKLPSVSSVRPTTYNELADPGALAGKKIGVPRMYIGKDKGLRERINLRQSILECWYQAASVLEALGATIIETDFPVVSNYDKDRDGAQNMYERGLVPRTWEKTEMCNLIAYGWENFLATNADPDCSSLADVDPSQIFPTAPGTIPDRDSELGPQAPIDEIVKVSPHVGSLTDIPDIAEALAGIENTRKVDFEDWLDAQGLDFVVFPANADVGKSNSDVDQKSNDDAWRNGVLFSNGNLAIRHLGIPSVTVPMGTMHDTRMPVGLTFAGKAYKDNALLRAAYAYEMAADQRHPPTLAPPLRETRLFSSIEAISTHDNNLPPEIMVTTDLGPQDHNGERLVVITGNAKGSAPLEASITVNGRPTKVSPYGTSGWRAQAVLPAESQPGSSVANPYWDIALVVVLVKDKEGKSTGQLIEIGRKGHD